MSILLGLAPFIAFFVVMRLSTPLIALAAAAVIAAALSARGLAKGGSVKILELGSVLLFGLLALYTWIAAPDWSVAGVRLAVDGGLTAIVLLSLAIRRPFTIQYAREQTPPAFWHQPLFIRTNDIITAVWALYFLICSLCDAAALWVPAVPLWLEVALSIGALLGAIYFSSWYPARIRRNIPRGASA